MREPKLHTFNNTKEATVIINGSNWSSLKSIACSQKNNMLTKFSVIHIHQQITYIVLRVDDIVWQDILYTIDGINTEPGDIIKVVADNPIDIIITI